MEPDLSKPGPKMAPRWSQMRPDQPIKMESGSEMTKNGPRSFPDKLEVAQHDPKTAPRLPKMAQERRHRGPRWGRDGPKIAQTGPKMVQNWFQVGEHEIEMGKIRPKRPRGKHVQTQCKNHCFYGVGSSSEGSKKPNLGPRWPEIG